MWYAGVELHVHIGYKPCELLTWINCRMCSSTSLCPCGFLNSPHLAELMGSSSSGPDFRYISTQWGCMVASCRDLSLAQSCSFVLFCLHAAEASWPCFHQTHSCIFPHVAECIACQNWQERGNHEAQPDKLVQLKNCMKALGSSTNAVLWGLPERLDWEGTPAYPVFLLKYLMVGHPPAPGL